MEIRNYAAEELLQKRKSLRRAFLENAHIPVRIAVLGGSTTNEVVDLLELLLLSEGFQPTFYQSEFNKYYEDAVLEPQKIKRFEPHVVYIHTHWHNVQRFPAIGSSEADFVALASAETERFASIWKSLEENVGAQIIQNNLEHPPFPILGNLDGVSCWGKTRFVYELNLEFAKAANRSRRLLIQDLNALAARVGQDRWFDWNRWHSYKIVTTPDGSLAIAQSLASMIAATLGKTKKCLVLDLDNTLWGGVIGDDGLDRIQIGQETAVAEAYAAFQKYCLSLRDRGILLAVCSKNEAEIAKTGFTHPDSVLKLEHFSCFKANWEPKHENIKAIAEELSLGLDSFVFVDDNPAERAIVAAQLPQVTVPNVGSDVSLFPGILQSARCFEPVTLSGEDLQRAETYAVNAQRAAVQGKFADYGEYLDSLNLTAEIEPFQNVYLERITQLINKSNQFNLTTRRYTFAEVERIALSRNHLHLYGKLTDTFGDNGLVSVIIGRREEGTLHIDLWIMSCRVLKRDVELAMLDTLIERANLVGIQKIVGYYRRTPKNGMVEHHYRDLGFAPAFLAENGSESVWTLNTEGYAPKNTHIQVRTLVHG
jgi:FkbH-like protein